MDISPHYKSTSHAVPSPTATHEAFLSGARLQIRSLASSETIRTINLSNPHDPKNCRIVWSPLTPTTHTDSRSRSPSAATPPHRSPRHSNRILLFHEDIIRVYDLRDEAWNAVISNGSGGMGKNVHAEFGANEDEILAWSDFGSCLKVWSLNSGRTVEIRDPKFSGRDGKGWGFRPSPSGSQPGRSSVMALLCRTSGTDVFMLLSSPSYTAISRTELATIDAAGLKWSHDGRWLAIWDAASAGHRLCIYTADGQLYRTIVREASEEANEWDTEGLGIKSVEWVPGNEWLAVGGWDRRVRILSTRTFAPAVFLDHTSVIHVPTAPVYTEQVDGLGNRTYALTSQPTTPPKPPLEKNATALMKQGISIVAFNATGSMCATRDDSTPSTVWIWDMKVLRPRCILIQTAPVKALFWHPEEPSRLLIQTAHDLPVVYLYSASNLASSTLGHSMSASQPPAEIVDLEQHIIKLPETTPTRWTASWLPTAPDRKPVFSLGHQQGHVLVWPEGKDQILRFESEDGEQSDDSLYDILTGRTPIPPRHLNSQLDGSVEDEQHGDSTGLDDTFRERRGRSNGTRGRSVFDESGMDEMF